MSPRDIKLSVITPVFNGVLFVERCIQNVIQQRCPEAEHILIDGGSTDGTVEIIKSYAERAGHIKWISQPDGGQSDAMNKGISQAAGEIIGFLNVDDFYEAGILSSVLQVFEDLRKPALLVGNCNVWDDDGKLLGISKPAQIGLLNLLKGRYAEAFPMNSSAYFYHKSLHERTGLYEVGEHFGMDLHFIFRAVQRANVHYIDRTLGNYCYLKETKTFKDTQTGMNSVRVRKITEHYRKQQPLHIRAYLSANEVWGRLQVALDRMKGR
jgi:glycosyltransferase involved in cell wall biosynthesis